MEKQDFMLLESQNIYFPEILRLTIFATDHAPTAIFPVIAIPLGKDVYKPYAVKAYGSTVMATDAPVASAGDATTIAVATPPTLRTVDTEGKNLVTPDDF